MSTQRQTPSPLRIAMVHSFYSSRTPSGENVVVAHQSEALRRAGHDVRVLARHTDVEERSRLFPLRAAVRVATGLGSNPLGEIEALAPDVVHLHNLFPTMGRRWVEGLHRPLVATLHNYRPLCPAGTLFRDGHLCRLCPDSGTARPAVTHRCYRDSRLATVPVALGTRFADDPVLRRADRLVVLTEDMREQYAAVGVDPARMVVVANFVPEAPAGRVPAAAGDAGEYWLYAGRLSPEKGIERLLRGWPAGRRLLVAGAGELSEAAAGWAAGSDIELLGQQPEERVRELMAGARGLCFPSGWREGLPTVYLEALRAGLPVLAWPESVVGDLVARDRTGVVVDGDLTHVLRRADRDFDELRARCREIYRAQYTETVWVRAITALYSSLL